MLCDLLLFFSGDPALTNDLIGAFRNDLVVLPFDSGLSRREHRGPLSVRHGMDHFDAEGRDDNIFWDTTRPQSELGTREQTSGTRLLGRCAQLEEVILFVVAPADDDRGNGWPGFDGSRLADGRFEGDREFSTEGSGYISTLIEERRNLDVWTATDARPGELGREAFCRASNRPRIFVGNRTNAIADSRGMFGEQRTDVVFGSTRAL